MATIELLCPACGGRLEASDLAPTCPSCHARIGLRSAGGFAEGQPLERCAACGSEALYWAKDFNKNLGVAIVALGCLGFLKGPMWGVGTLAVLTVIDRVVYWLRPVVTVCYACKAVYRDLPRNPRHRPYELTYDETFEGTGEPPAFEPGRSEAAAGPTAGSRG